MRAPLAARPVIRSSALETLRAALAVVPWFCAYLADDVYSMPASSGSTTPIWPPLAGTPALPGVAEWPALIKQGAAGNQPTLSLAHPKYNNRPAVEFATSALKTPSLFTPQATPCTIFVVGHADTVGVNRFFCGGSDDAGGREMFRGSGSRMNSRGASASGTIVQDAAYSADQAQIHVFQMNGAASRHRVNGYETPGTTGAGTTQQHRVGCRANQSTADALIGGMAFFGVVYSAMTTADIETVEAAFAAYYAKTLAPATYLRGGQVTEPGDGYRYHTFTGAGTLTLVGPGTVTVEYLVAGGGGGSGRSGGNEASGGGGGGQVLTGSGLVIAANQAVTVGAGGTAGSTGTVAAGQGGSSSLGAITALGGAGSKSTGQADTNGQQGGSGSGGGAKVGSAGTAGAANGTGTSAGGAGVANAAGGGGGGANAAGADAASATTGGAGGQGIEWPAASGTRYGGGGGGGGKTGGAGGAGGAGGGGAGGIGQGVSGTANTGGGAGGTGTSGAVGRGGGTGVVIVRYPI